MYNLDSMCHLEREKQKRERKEERKKEEEGRGQGRIKDVFKPFFFHLKFRVIVTSTMQDIFIHSFIHSSNKYLLSTYNVPGIVSGQRLKN